MDAPEMLVTEGTPAAAVTAAADDDDVMDVEEQGEEKKEGDQDETLYQSSATSCERTDTEVEQIAERIERRRSERTPVTFRARVRFLKGCRRIALQKNYQQSRISKSDLAEFRSRIHNDLEQGKGLCNSVLVHDRLGVKSDVRCLADILDRAVNLLETDRVDTGTWLYYRDFSADYTRVVSRWPLLRSQLAVAGLVVFLYYLLTPVLFCVVMPSSTICTVDEDGPQGAAGGYQGWVSALYFASTTMSTVGYGDLTVDQDPKYRSFVGSVYMLLSMVVAVVAFSALAATTFSPFEKSFQRLFDRFNCKPAEDQFLHQRIAKVKFVRITELTIEIFSYILFGVICSQIVVYFDTEKAPGTDWSWMTSFYWAVQTATTIGYGDLAQPQSLRYFKIFYLMFSTVLVGNALGKLGVLRDELAEARKRHAWDRRQVSKRMVDEMQAYNHDDKVDQYEFLVASLVSLGTLSLENDIRPVMDKFRTHAGAKGYIAVDDEVEDDFGDDVAEVERDIMLNED